MTRHFRPLAYIPSNGTLYIFTKIEVTNEESIENFSLELIHVLTNTKSDCVTVISFDTHVNAIRL